MLEHDCEDSVGFWVFVAAHAIEATMNESLAEVGITFRQCQVLGCLALRGEVPQTELAEMLRVEPSAVVRIVDRMERDGWIERVPDPTDRRKKQIRPTSRAEPVWKTIRALGMENRSRALAGMTEDEVADLRRLLRKMVENLDRETPFLPKTADGHAQIPEPVAD
ncbi:MAG: MarR family transcriptional regulator [Planctomycetota bacterium]